MLTCLVRLSSPFPKAWCLDATWVAHRWLPSLGLPQHSEAFNRQMVDGRLLSVLTRKDLERHLGVQRKFHQSSILHAIQLLRSLNFDKEVSPPTPASPTPTSLPICVCCRC